VCKSQPPPLSNVLGRLNAIRVLPTVSLFTLALANLGCQHIGSSTLGEDRLAYNNALSTSWKQQILLNIVRLHYHDTVDFVDITQVAQSRSLTDTASATVSASILPWGNIIGNTLNPSLMGSRARADTPTVNYVPQSSSDFIRNLNGPITPYLIFNLIEGGYRADYVLGLSVKSIDEINNFDTNFDRLADAIADAIFFQGDVSFPAESQPDGSDQKIFMMIAQTDSKPCKRCRSTDPVAVIRQLLHLRAALTKFEIVPGKHPKEGQIAVETRSVISAMRLLSDYVPWNPNVGKNPDPPLKVFSNNKKPSGNYVTIRYRGNWFWIEQDNERSNISMVYLRTLLALADTGARPTAPALTIPVSR